jgi:predicted component of type VI protein secretion system
MNVKLVVEQGAKRRAFTVQSEEAILGRARGCAVRIPSAEVSRQHCRLTVEDGLVRIKDLGSVNGTLLNGRKIRGVESVRPGDNLTVGPVTFVVEYELTPDALERLHGDEDPVALLDDLADGEVVLEADDEPAAHLDLDMLEDLEEVLPVVEPVEEMEEVVAVVDDDLIPADVGDVPPWQLPEGSAFRDMLSDLEDDGGSDGPPKKKKGR